MLLYCSSGILFGDILRSDCLDREQGAPRPSRNGGGYPVLNDVLGIVVLVAFLVLALLS